MAPLGVFVPDQADPASQPVELATIAPASDGRLSEPAWSEQFGGPVAVHPLGQRMTSRDGWVEAVYHADGRPPERVVGGVVQVEAKPISPLGIICQKVARILVREQSF